MDEETTDSEKLISEVGKRPPLYDKTKKEYSDRMLKEKLWEEVCGNIFQDWDTLSPGEKQNKGNDIQKKWKNIRDCFSRELAAQKKVKSGQPYKKRRKYIYFDSLLFLLPSLQKRETSGNVSPFVKTPENQTEDCGTTSLQQKPTSTTGKHFKKSLNYEEQIINILQQKCNEEVDEDKSFAMMLIPMFKKFNEDQKHFAKIEILNIMNRTKHYCLQAPLAPADYRSCTANILTESDTNFQDHNQQQSFLPTVNNFVLEKSQNLFQLTPDVQQAHSENSGSTSHKQRNPERITSYIANFSNELSSDASSTSVNLPFTTKPTNSDYYKCGPN